MAKFLLTAGQPKATPPLLFGDRLLSLGHSISAVLMVSPWQWTRARQIVRQRGKDWVLGRLRGRASSPSAAALREMAAGDGGRPPSIRTWAREKGIPVHRLSDLNDSGVVERVRALRPDAVIYGGGGILRQPFISAAGRVLNAHAGPLPEVRGMNAAEWAFLLGEPPAVTIHLIDAGIDTGPLLLREEYDVGDVSTIDELRARAVLAGVRAMIAVLERGIWADPGHSGESPPPGRQCFVMAPILKDLLEVRLASR